MEISLPWAEDISYWANWTLVGALLIGVLATYAIVVSSNAKEHHWAEERRLSGERISANEKETKRAIADSDIAKAGAATANERAAGLEAESEKARFAIAEAVKQTETAKASAAEANRKAEQERLERIRLEAVVSPRSLSLDQQRLIAGFWKQHAGKRVSVTSYALDAEGAGLATQIMACLGVATIEVDNRLASQMPLGGFSLGIHVSGNDSNLVNSIRTALSGTGRLTVAAANTPAGGGLASMETGSPDGDKPVAASILVGVKPVATIR